ncbi:MAG: SIMPL domain-containing protein [Patescibacteria group bacterium]|nr:SIMPL domain-containing protein [Patescibacteria group bacterium]
MVILNKKEEGKANSCDCCGSCGCMLKKVKYVVFGILLIYLVFYLGVLTRNGIKQYNFIGKADRQERTITMSGIGKVVGNNDIALTTIGYSNVNKDVAKAQAENKKVMDGVLAELKKLGIEDKDVESDYSIYPEYNYTEEKGQEMVGYRISHRVSVKIRNLEKISDVLGLASKTGVNEVGGINFTVDDQENLKSQAREKAIVDLRAKAEQMEKTLGVKFGNIVSYNEYGGDDYNYSLKYGVGGMGGGAEAVVPDVAVGSKEVTMNVNVTFEILGR